MSAYEGSKRQEEDEKRKKYTSNEAIDMALKTVKSMGISQSHNEQLQNAFRDGYNKAIADMQDKLLKLRL